MASKGTKCPKRRTPSTFTNSSSASLRANSEFQIRSCPCRDTLCVSKSAQCTHLQADGPVRVSKLLRSRPTRA